MPKTKEDILSEIAKPSKEAKIKADKLGVNFSKLISKIAKRDHIIVQNDFKADIKKGDNLDDIPERFYETLKAEKVI